MGAAGRVAVAVVEDTVSIETEFGKLGLEQVEQLEPIFQFGKFGCVETRAVLRDDGFLEQVGEPRG